MTVKRKQHYVPRFYLRNFADESAKGQISLWNISRQLLVRDAAIADQAYENFFYGIDGVLEEELSRLEDKISIVIKNILEKETLPTKGSDDQRLLYAYTMYPTDRTKAAATDIEQMLNTTTALNFRKPIIQKAVIDDAPWTKKGTPAFALELATSSLTLILDLQAKLLLNRTDFEFMTSDNPVVRYNQFYEYRRRPGSGAGWSLLGLQVFLPLSPRVAMILYDNDIYRIGKDNEETFSVAEATDINLINGLQYLRADENVYFSPKIAETRAARMHRRWVRYRAPRVSTNAHPAIRQAEGKTRTGKVIYSEFNNLRIGLDLSFIWYKIVPEDRKLNPTLWNPRNKYVEAELEKIYNKAPKNERL